MTASKKKNFKAVIIGVFIWVLFASFSYKIAKLVISSEYSKYFPIFSLTSYLIVASLVASFFVGLIGKSKGWLLGCAMQMVITLILVLYFLTSGFVHEQITSTGANYVNAFFKYIYGQLPWYLASIVGGFLGEQAKRLKKSTQ